MLALNDLIVPLMSVFDHIYQEVHNNCEIIDRNDNKWSQLGFLEAFYIKNFSLQLMKALKPPENKTHVLITLFIVYHMLIILGISTACVTSVLVT